MYKLPETLPQQLDTFAEQIDELKKGEINPVAFKGVRVTQGIYEQRKPQTFMVRIRCAAGICTPMQLRKVAQLSEKYGTGFLHITTRQEVQLHNVLLDNLEVVQRELFTVGLSSRGGGGNTVRNITASHDSGIATDEVFDVAPYASELTTRMLNEPDSFGLPRKYKVAFSNSSSDNARATFGDLGFIAHVLNGVNGFRVYCAGGMGAKSQVGQLLFDFIPADKVYFVAKGLKLMFDKYGNRRKKHHSRLRFLWETLGAEEFRNRFMEEYMKLVKDPGLSLDLSNQLMLNGHKRGFPELIIRDDRDFFLWKKRYVKEQKQEGFSSIEVPLQLGDLKLNDAFRIANVLEDFGDDTIRFCIKQNMHFRNIPSTYLGNIYQLLQEIDSLSFGPRIIGNMIACTGADTCKLGICLPRGLSPQIRKKLLESNLDLEPLSNINIFISGCPNSCGCHHAGDIGFFGKAMRNGTEILPAYTILAGAIVEDGKSRLASKVDEVSARDLPDFIVDLLGKYITVKTNHDTFASYIDSEGQNHIRLAADKYRNVPSFSKDNKYYYDWGATEKFSLLKGQEAECSAGLYDMIEVDKRLIEGLFNEIKTDLTTVSQADRLYQLVFYSSRMLLVTRGIEPRGVKEVFNNFIAYFIETGLLDGKYRQIVEKAADERSFELPVYRKEVFQMAEKVIELYTNMDDSLNFNVVVNSNNDVAQKARALEEFEIRQKDFRGVQCPMNFVKTKIELSSMQKGDILEIFLDDGLPIKNVPGSVKSEGHQILEEKMIDNYWVVKICKQ